MNHYRLQDLHLGQQEHFSTTVTEEKMALFCQLTGDISPIHVDEAAAKARGHSGRVVYGMLGASLFSTLAGVWLPGSTCLLHSVEASFVRPVYVGDTLTVTGTVKEINTAFGQVVIKAVITNAKGEKVTRGLIKAGVVEV